jgi:hypothetical protein
MFPLARCDSSCDDITNWQQAGCLLRPALSTRPPCGFAGMPTAQLVSWALRVDGEEKKRREDCQVKATLEQGDSV